MQPVQGLEAFGIALFGAVDRFLLGDAVGQNFLSGRQMGVLSLPVDSMQIRQQFVAFDIDGDRILGCLAALVHIWTGHLCLWATLDPTHSLCDSLDGRYCPHEVGIPSATSFVDTTWLPSSTN